MSISEFLVAVESATHHKPARSGEGYVCRCPAHEDGNPSLSVSEGDGGRILVKCHAGCTFEAIVAAVGLSPADLAPDSGTAPAKRGRPAKFATEREYDYRDKDGKLLFQVCRMVPKSFRQRRPDVSAVGGWNWSTKGVRQVPFRLPELIAAVKAGETVYIAEGEKDVESLVHAGIVATCNAGGAGKWRSEFGEYFDGAKMVVVIADKDVPGRAHAASVAALLKPLCRSVKVIELPDIGASPVKDAADFFAAGGTAEQLRKIAADAPDYVPKAELTPSTWFKQRFPKLAEKHGEPVHEMFTGKLTKVRDLSEDFIAATIGEVGMPEAPTVYLPSEGRFYAYNPETGIFEPKREEDIASGISGLLLECARECRDSADTTKLEFQLRKTAALAGVLKRAKGLLAVSENYFISNSLEFLPVANGMLRLRDRELLPFSPSYQCRHKLAVSYQADAKAPLFENKLLLPALASSDVSLIQRWAGLSLLGINLSQRILLIVGTAGGGKSTLVSVLLGVIGQANVGTLRTEFLDDRFEISRFVGKTVLYGADVQEDFLTSRTASRLKSLTGGDMMTVEFKNSNESPVMKCQFNVVVTSNSRLVVFLEGDADAWRRRLAIVSFNKPKPAEVIPNLAERILAEEGPGVLNFMLDGGDALRNANWELRLNTEQQGRVDNLLLESDSVGVFATDCLIKDSTATGFTKADAFAAYSDFCEKRGWAPKDKARFGKLIVDEISQAYGLGVRNDIIAGSGKQNDGWKSLRLRTEGDAEI